MDEKKTKKRLAENGRNYLVSYIVNWPTLWRGHGARGNKSVYVSIEVYSVAIISSAKMEKVMLSYTK